MSTKYGSSRSGSRASSRMGGSIAGSSSGLAMRSGFFSSKGNLYSSSRKGLHSESKTNISLHQIMDEDGIDVTPKPLIQLEPQQQAAGRHLKMNAQKMPGASESIFSQKSMLGGGAGNASFMQPMRSMFGGSMMDTGGTNTGSVTGSVMGSMIGSMMGSMMGSVIDGGGGIAPTVSRPETSTDIRIEEEILTVEDLDKLVNTRLKETETIWHLDIPSTWVPIDSDDLELIKNNNNKYEELCKSKFGNDKYSDRGVQTINEPKKMKHVQTDAIQRKEADMFTSDYEMYDTMQLIERLEVAEKKTGTATTISSVNASQITSRIATPSVASRSLAQTPLSSDTHSLLQSVTPGGGGTGNSDNSIFSVSVQPNMTMYSTREGGVGFGKVGAGAKWRSNNNEEIDPSKPNNHPILKMESLRDNLRTLERAVVMNVLHNKQAMYRNLPLLPDPNRPVNILDTISVSAPHLEELWTFSSPYTDGRAVTCLTWNTANKDIVAVGYSEISSSKQSTNGIVCCWSIKNPQHPERIYYSSCGVTSISFSEHHPNLLAAGLYNGTIEIYNCRTTYREPVLTSRDSLFKHAGPVWQVEWVAKERSFGEDRSEVLISVGSDGRVLQWTLRKGIESIQLMRLKRLQYPKQAEKKVLSNLSRAQQTTQPQPKHKLKQSKNQQAEQQQEKRNQEQDEATITQFAPGMGFAFDKSDSNIYLVCTEEGDIHKCSCSYNEQFLDTYKGHTGPVYKVIWHPDSEDLFLSCSGDWTVRLWNQDTSDKPLHVFQVSQKKQDFLSKPSGSRRRKGTDEKVDHSHQEAVRDIGWSPHDSTAFVCVRGGRVELWCLQQSVLDPFLVHKSISDSQHTRALFGLNSDILLIGNSKGRVSVYMPRNVPPPPTDKTEALENVLDALKTSSD